MLIKRSLHQSPEHPVSSAKAMCKQRKKILNGGKKKRKKFIQSAVWRGGFILFFDPLNTSLRSSSLPASLRVP
jgi:hypothetical protein